MPPTIDDSDEMDASEFTADVPLMFEPSDLQVLRMASVGQQLGPTMIQREKHRKEACHNVQSCPHIWCSLCIYDRYAMMNGKDATLHAAGEAGRTNESNCLITVEGVKDRERVHVWDSRTTLQHRSFTRNNRPATLCPCANSQKYRCS